MPQLPTSVPGRSCPASRPGWRPRFRQTGPRSRRSRLRYSSAPPIQPWSTATPPTRSASGEARVMGPTFSCSGAPAAERGQRPTVQPRQHPRWGLPDDRVHRRLRGLYGDDAERVRGRWEPVGLPGGRLVVAMAPGGCQHQELPRYHAEHKLHSPRARGVRAAAKRRVRVQLRQIAVAGHS